MAKIYGITGLVSGKLGGAVYAIRNGEQIARQYNPSPAQPKTAKQTEQQAKLKLLSQLSAVLGPVIAIRRIGAKTPRNLFTKTNYPLVSYAEDMANINLNRVQITKSVVGMLPFNANRTSGTGIAVRLDSDAAGAFDKVVYVSMVKGTDDTLRLFDSIVVDDPAENNIFPGTLKYTDAAVVILAYGVRENTDRARSAFGNLTANAAEALAKLIVTRAVNDNDVTLTETLGLTMAVGETTGDSENFERAIVTLTASGNGTVSGGGRYEVGTQVTIRATPVSGSVFVGWYAADDPSAPISTSATYSFVAEHDISLIARFRSEIDLTIALEVNATSVNINNQSYSNGDTLSLEPPASINYSIQYSAGTEFTAQVLDANGSVLSSASTPNGSLQITSAARRLKFRAAGGDE